MTGNKDKNSVYCITIHKVCILIKFDYREVEVRSGTLLQLLYKLNIKM